MILFIKENLRRWPYFLIGAPLVYLLHLCTEYFSVFSITDLFTPISAWFVGIPLLLFFLVSLVWKPLLKYAFLFFYIEVVFFFFGAIHDFLKLYIAFLARYKFIIPLIIAGAVFLFFSARKKAGHNQKLFLYLNTLFFILVTIELVQCVTVTATAGRSRFWFDKRSTDPVSNLPTCDSCTKPDIYFIVFDEYAGARSLQAFWRYDNSNLDSFFRQQGFFYAAHSTSNYNSTAYSIGSILNMDYHNKHFYTRVDISQFCQGIRTIENNTLCHLLQKNNYSIINQSLFRIPGSNTGSNTYFFSPAPKIIFSQTFCARLLADIGWGWGTSRLNVLFRNQERTRASRAKTINTYNNLLKVSAQQNKNPAFVYAHFLLPHGPYFFDSTGRFTPEDSWYDPKNGKELYLSQLKYTNTLIKNIVTHLKAEGNRPRIIIIQSDHGYRAFPDKQQQSLEFDNLNAVYFPDGNYAQLYDSVSSVNTFRVILRQYFQAPIPLLKDSTVSIPR
jgi:hypothetical protein